MKRFVLLLLVVFVLPTALVVGQGPEETLVRALTGGDISTLNPALISDSSSIDVATFVWDGLYQADPETGAPLPKLTTWEVSEDGLTYTFTFVDGAVWSDGSPITSNDVLFTYNAILDDSVPSPRKADMDLVESLNVIDDKTFEVVLSDVNCTVWGGAFSSLTPVPSALYAADFSDFVDNPINLSPKVTSGPYIVDEYSPGDFVRLSANENYREGAPQIPFILNRVLADTAIQNQALLSGEVDYAFMYPDQLEQLGGPANLNAFVEPLNNTPLFVMNWEDPTEPQAAYDEDGNAIEQTPNKFFSDVRVRQAIAMGYDKGSIVGTLGPDGGFLLNGPFTPLFGWAQEGSAVEPYPYDPEAAAALLDEAGWVLNADTGIREKDGVPFSFELVYSPLVDLWTNIALVAQDQLGQLGIEVKVTSMEWSAYLNDVLVPQKFDATIVGFGGGIEVDGIAYSILYSENDIPGSGFNLASYVNPDVDALLEQGRSTVGCSQADRAAAYNEINRIVKEDVAYDFTVGTNQVFVMNSRIQNFEPGAFNSHWQIPSWSIGPGE
jgi:peptide/nickel transport system substrate-binding protein